MKFRPCIDIHNGQVKQIVGGTLRDQGDQAVTNFEMCIRDRERRLVGDTDVGRELKEQVRDLERLLAAYRSGDIIEKI